MDDEKELHRLNQLFYRCLETLDMSCMETIWLQEDWVRSVHPGWDVLVGWDAIRGRIADLVRALHHGRGVAHHGIPVGASGRVRDGCGTGRSSDTRTSTTSVVRPRWTISASATRVP